MKPWNACRAIPFLSALAMVARPLEAWRQTDDAASLQRFQVGLGGGFAPEWNGDELSARGRLALAADVAGRQAEIERVLASVLDLAAGAGALVQVHATRMAGFEILQFEQRVGGLPVLGSRVELCIAGSTLTRLRSRGLGSTLVAGSPQVEREDAGILARSAVPAADPTRAWSTNQGLALRREAGGALRRVWRVHVWNPLQPLETWDTLVDAGDGSMLEIRPGIVEGVSGLVDGRGMAIGPQTLGAPAVLPLADLYVSAVDAAAASKRVTDDTCQQTEGSISADGTRIAWVSTCDGDSEIWTALADGSVALQLTSNLDLDISPCLSADGSKVFFVSDRDGDLELFSIAPNGTGLTQLTFNSVPDHSVAVSGDGSRVVFARGLGTMAEIVTKSVGAPGELVLTSNAVLDEKPHISRDGSRIAWVSWLDGDADIHCIDPDGSDLDVVTGNDVLDTDPQLRGDGLRVAFSSRLAYDVQSLGDPSLGVPTATRRLFPREQFDVFEAASDGSQVVRRTSSDADETAPAFGADGGCIAYVSTSNALSDLFALDLATNLALPLTHDTSADRAPRVSSTCDSGVWLAHDGDWEVFTWGLAGPGDKASTTTDAAGAFSLDVPDGKSPSISVDLTGKWTRIVDLDPTTPSVREFASAVAPASGIDLHCNPSGFVEGPTAQVTAYAHLERAHAYLDDILRRAPLSMLGVLPIDVQLLARVNFPQAIPNAYYAPARDEATFFIGAGPTRPNTAYDTLAYHEYGHFLDDQDGGIAPASACEAEFALSEGIGDALATFLSASPVVGDGFFGAGSWIRNYSVFPWSAPGGEKGRQYGCEDCPQVGGKPEVHAHGAAFAGFAWDLRGIVGDVTAEDLVFGAVFSNPPHMQAAVYEVFALAATPAFGGSGDPATSPLAPAICTAAAKHGFDCPLRADHASYGCHFTSLCGPVPARHRVIGTEWLGTFVDAETSCEPPPNFDDDGVVVPPHLGEGTFPPLSVTMRVNPALKSSGRYGAPLPHPQLEERRVFLNGWLFIDNGMGSFDPHKVFGHGTATGVLAYNPDTWPGDSLTVGLTFKVPEVPVDRLGILRVRFDYGEDSGRLIDDCMSDPTLAGPCGVARFGEVEEYQVAVLDSGS